MAQCQDTSRQKFISDHVWNKNKKLLTKNLNTKLMLDIFTQEGLISFDDVSNFHQLQFDTDKSPFIFNVIPKCGKSDYLVVFLKCMKDSFDDAGQAHEEIVEKLETDYKAALSNPPPEPCSIVLKRNWYWIIVHSTSLLWLLLGIIASVIITQVPTVQPSHPTSLIGLADPVMAEIDLGIHPFWLSSASFQLLPESEPSQICRVDLYVLENRTCDELPTVTEYHTRESGTLLDPPYYLLEGSVLNITIGDHTGLPNTQQFSVLYVEGTTQDCDDFNFGNCQSAPPELTYKCQVGERGQTLETYQASNSDFYTFCSDGFFGNSFSLKDLTYNVSEIRQMFQNRATLSSRDRNSYLVPFSNSFNIAETRYCLLLDVDRTLNRCTGSSSFTLHVDIQRRTDFPLLGFFTGFALFLIHLLITGLAHCCYVCRGKRKLMQDNEE